MGDPSLELVIHRKPNKDTATNDKLVAGHHHTPSNP